MVEHDITDNEDAGGFRGAQQVADTFDAQDWAIHFIHSEYRAENKTKAVGKQLCCPRKNAFNSREWTGT
jgi:hypothetical protein